MSYYNISKQFIQMEPEDILAVLRNLCKATTSEIINYFQQGPKSFKVQNLVYNDLINYIKVNGKTVWSIK